MADRIVDLLTLAGVLALVALPVAVLVIGVLVWINRRRARAIKDWASRHGDLKRRLADVEALRRAEQGKLQREPVNLAEHPDHAASRYLEELREAMEEMIPPHRRAPDWDAKWQEIEEWADDADKD